MSPNLTAKKTVLVTGATGFLGRQVVKAFKGPNWTVKGTGFSRADGQKTLRVDLSKRDELTRVMGEVGPDVVVHCAANRFPDKVDADPKGTRLLNVAATATLAELCAARDALLIYVSTDYVFSGKPGEAPYAADAATAPTNLYGVTKQDGEREVFRMSNKAVVLRVPMLYGAVVTPTESVVNVLADVVRKAALEGGGGKKMKIDHWALRYPTNTEDVARVCHDVASRYLCSGEAAKLPRIVQFSSEDRFTKYEMCELFAEILSVRLAESGIEANVEGNDPKASVQRPYDCHLSTAELKGIGVDVSTQDFVGWWRREMRAFRH